MSGGRPGGRRSFATLSEERRPLQTLGCDRDSGQVHFFVGRLPSPARLAAQPRAPAVGRGPGFARGPGSSATPGRSAKGRGGTGPRRSAGPRGSARLLLVRVSTEAGAEGRGCRGDLPARPWRRQNNPTVQRSGRASFVCPCTAVPSPQSDVSATAALRRSLRKEEHGEGPWAQGRFPRGAARPFLKCETPLTWSPEKRQGTDLQRRVADPVRSLAVAPQVYANETQRVFGYLK